MIIDLFSVQQVILPLLEQYVKSHHLYFLSASSSDNRSHASRKEKEMIAWYKTKFAFLFFILLSDHFSAILCIFIYFYLFKKIFACFQKKASSYSLFLFCVLRFSVPLLPLLSLCFLFTCSLFCKLAALVRHRISVFGKDSVDIITFICLLSVNLCFNPHNSHIMCACVFSGREASSVASSLHVLAQALDAR